MSVRYADDADPVASRNYRPIGGTTPVIADWGEEHLSPPNEQMSFNT